jgi:cold shock CspA family protein
MQNMAQARVKWFNRHNCYGFIEMDDGSDALVHFCSVEGAPVENLCEGDLVSLEMDRAGKIARMRKL